MAVEGVTSIRCEGKGDEKEDEDSGGNKLVLAGVTVSGEDVGVVVHAATGDAVVTITGLVTCPMIE